MFSRGMIMNEKRLSPRQLAKGQFRVHTNLMAGPQTVVLKDVGQKGAFILTKYIPATNEVITVSALDSSWKETSLGNARVVWSNSKETQGPVGYAIELDNEIPGKIIESVV
jgi:hypothetical protein